MLKFSLTSILLLILSWSPDRSLRATPLKPSVRFARLPLAFEAWPSADGNPLYFSRGRDFSMLLSATRLDLAFSHRVSENPRLPGDPFEVARRHRRPMGFKRGYLSLRLAGADTEAAGRTLDPLPGISNYFLGNDPAQWRTRIAQAGKVEFKGIYPGVDLVYYGNEGRVEHDFIVHPGTDYRAIEWEVQGVLPATIDLAGDLVLKDGDEVVRFAKPQCYETRDTGRKELEGHFIMRSTRRVGFEVLGHDPRHQLVIDPVLFYSTYLGGSGSEDTRNIAVDPSGNAFISGYVDGPFPTTAGAYQTTITSGQACSFVGKLNSTGSALLYSTYLGGNTNAYTYGIDIDGTGSAYVVGETWNSFPVTAGAAQVSVSDGGSLGEGFAAKIDPTGSVLVYSTYLGGSLSSDSANGIAVDSAGNAFITGYTQGGFQVTAGAFQTVFPGGSSAFVCELNPSGSALVYSTYLGSGSVDSGNAIAIDASGNAYIAGGSNGSAFPVTVGAFQTALAGSSDAFVTKLDPTGSSLVYSTFLGGGTWNGAYAIALDGANDACIAGTTNGVFPTTPGAFQTTFGGTADVFVSKLDPTGSSTLYSSYLGGSGYDDAYGIAVNGSGQAVVTGDAEDNFPVTAGAYQPVFQGAADIFVSKFDVTGSTLVGSTYLGSSAYDSGNGIALDGSGNAYIGGYVDDGFPTTAGAFQTIYGGPGGSSTDGFVVKLDVDDVPLATPTFTGTSTATQTALSTPTSTLTPTLSATVTVTFSQTLTPSATNTPSFSASPSATTTATRTATLTGTPTSTMSMSFTPSAVYTATPTWTSTPTMTVTSTPSVSGTMTLTGTPSATVTLTFSLTSTATQSATSMPSPTISPTGTISGTISPTPPLGGSSTPPGPDLSFIYPSPAQGDLAHLAYHMSKAGRMTVLIWNARGDLAARVEDTKPAGLQTTEIPIRDFAAGVYLYEVFLHYDFGVVARLGIQKFSILK